MKPAILKSFLRRSTMLRAATTASAYLSTRSFSSTPERKVAILGAAGGVRQPLSLLMKLNPLVSSLSLYDIGGTPSVAADVSHINTRSETTPKANLSDEDIKALTKRTQDGGTEVVEAKAGKGSATLSMAYAGALSADAYLKGLNGVPDVVECSHVQSSVTELPFFASKVRLGKNGLDEILGFGPLSDYELQGLEELKSELRSPIGKGVTWHKYSDIKLFSVYEPMKPTFRPLSPHLPIYKPQLNSTVSIFNRMTGVILTVFPLSYCFLCLKVGPICLSYEDVYQLFYYSSKLGPISLELTALALAYHTYFGVHHLLQLVRGKV